MRNPLSVLLAEDDAALRRCLTEVLAAQGWAVHSAGTGPDAVALARHVALDFSLLDMHLPGMTGIEVYRAIARMQGPRPWILMSGQASKEDTAIALALGAHTFLRKPLDLNALRSSLAELIQRHFGTGGSMTPPRPTL
jgi:CheY-like chemotaxis protein